MKKQIRFRALTALLALAGCLSPGTQSFAGKSGLWEPWPEDSYYETYPVFHQFPDETGKKKWAVYRLGPVGIGIDLTMPAFGMKVRNVEEGSPAAQTGQLKAGQVIESINGQTLKDIDPRVLLGNVITKAEATDGKVVIRVKDQANAPARDVLVQIPVLGAYSPTWPLNCPKSDKIVRGIADYLATNGDPLSALGHDQSLLFLLSTGEAKDLQVARDWVRQIIEHTKDREELGNIIPWSIGYGTPALCEYYLRTGDAAVLPLIQKVADQAARLMYNGGWNHRTRVNFRYGHMNAAGVHCVKFLLLAKECGVDVDDYTLQTSLRHFFRFAGRGNVPYGNGLPEGGFVDNGKVGGLAFAMAAAASLHPDGEKSVYAKARDASAVKGFYSTSWMHHGHTGGGIGETWRSSAIALMYHTKPEKFREFVDNRTWHLDLSRRFNGAMCILNDTDYGRNRYDSEKWGTGYAMTYTVPRKTLRMTGAPPSQYSHPYRLPERPWGTPADDAFYSLEPADGPGGPALNVDAERLVTDASWPLLRKLMRPGVPDELVLQYCRHPDYNVRVMATEVIRDQKRDHLILPLLRAKDPRVRHAGVLTIWTETNGAVNIGASRLTAEMTDELIAIIHDPQESWWIVQNAIAALSLAPAEKIATQLDVLLTWLKHDEWWMQQAATRALTPLLADPELAKRIIPEIGEMAAQDQVGATILGLRGVTAALSQAPPEIQTLARDHLLMAYSEFPVDLKAHGGADMSNAVDLLHGTLATAITTFPEGFDQLYRASRKVLPDESLPYKHLYFKADFSKFGDELAKAMPSIIVQEIIPESIGANIDQVQEELLWAKKQESYRRSTWAYGALDDLIQLYNEAGIHDYDWKPFGPKRDEIQWDYFTFDAPELTGNIHNNSNVYIDRLKIAENEVEKAKRRVADLEGKVRWQLEHNGSPEQVKAAEARVEEAKQEGSKVYAEWQQAMLAGHLPKGLESWFAPDFAPSRAGWKTGRAPFANNKGELKAADWRCKLDFCRCSLEPNTFWENGVLLMRTKLQVPPLQPDHRYRILVGGNIHSKQGAPILIYVNGKPVHQQGGFGGRLRGKPRGIFIDKNIAAEFAAGPVTLGIAALRTDDKPAYLTAWIDQMKMPVYTQAEMIQARARGPMFCAEWQDLQDPETGPKDPNEGKYRFNGRFEDNPAIRGSWQLVGKAETIDAFEGSPTAPQGPSIMFHPDGSTNDPNRLWTNDKVLQLEKKEALQLTTRKINGVDYLFMEAGGFDKKNPKGWQSPFLVLQRSKAQK